MRPRPTDQAFRRETSQPRPFSHRRPLSQSDPWSDIRSPRQQGGVGPEWTGALFQRNLIRSDSFQGTSLFLHQEARPGRYSVGQRRGAQSGVSGAWAPEERGEPDGGARKEGAEPEPRPREVRLSVFKGLHAAGGGERGEEGGGGSCPRSARDDHPQLRGRDAPGAGRGRRDHTRAAGPALSGARTEFAARTGEGAGE